ncbi:uncharacterized protein LOC101862874 [Aplysia californica]|uniref:Uncharacterized protein LOC101862874 n=1 Tax=Aplysia californica TaxID=6500 RepID=A0ABM0JQP0_APLCA|nr:uncharacterized protein LOC101862874 [Aplysia californica]
MTVGWKTLDVGEKALIYSKDGSYRVEEGPQRIFLFRETFRSMSSYSASQKEYLVVKFKDGRVQNLRGPCTAHFNEVIHLSIKVKDMVSLSANEALVVYKQDDATKNVLRDVLLGPSLIMLNENEWLHSFCWHGTDPNNKTRMVRGIDQFTVLKIIPDQFYYNVDEVRTADDALLRVKLMMFYELTDIEEMLNTTKDPIADFINCLCADVITFASKKTYEEFIETASELNDLKNFPQLTERCAVIGYVVTKVAFRGYFAHDKLQKMHDMMSKKRTELQMKYEKEVQEQSLKDLKLEAEIERLEQEQELELQKLIHNQKMEIDSLKHKLELEKTSRLRLIEEKTLEDKAKLNAQIAKEQLEAEHLHSLHGLGVNITDLLVSRAGRPEKVTSIVASKGGAAVHIHHNDLALSGNVLRTGETAKPSETLL